MKSFRSLFLLVSIAMLGACVSPRAPRDYVALYGDPVPPAAAMRTIEIGPDTQYVNVEGGETVRFVVGDRQFGWAFNVARTVFAFDLSEVAPPGMLMHPVQAYVAPDPRYYSAPTEP